MLCFKAGRSCPLGKKKNQHISSILFLKQLYLDFYFFKHKTKYEKCGRRGWKAGAQLVEFNCKWVSWTGHKACFSLRSAPQPQLGMSTLTACRVATHKLGRKQPLGSLVNCAGWAKKTISFLEKDQNNWFVCPSIRGNTWEHTFMPLLICQDSVHFKTHKSFREE